MLAAKANVQRRHQEVLAAEADVQRLHEEVLAAEAEVQRCHKEVLVAEADVQRCHEEVLAVEAANVQRWHELAARATESDAAIERIRTEFALWAAPLDAILAAIACKEAAITTTLSPGHPTSYVDAVLSNMGGAHNCLCPSLARRLYHCLTSPANSRLFVPVPNLAVALADAPSLERPVLTSWWLPPTLNYYRGGFLCRLPPRWREQLHLVARWCRLLRLAGRHLILPPSNPLHSMKELFFLPGEGTPIHSVREDFLFLHGSEHDASTARTVLVGIISLALPINLLDGLRWGGSICCFKYIPLEDFFPLPPPGILVLLDPSPSPFFGSLRPSPIVFPIPFWLHHMKSWGGCWDRDVDTISTLGSLFSLPLTPCIVRVGDRSLTPYSGGSWCACVCPSPQF